ncbi:hypothetical protein [Nonomuraea sp. NPDC049400]|uniref:hypothetical protein n=1 Tax=Nonomuraea sp. NPDC049400 TaxID=3364352 RepID=UPI0037997239
MRAAWYDRQGPAREVLDVGELPTPEPGPGEVRVKVAASGVHGGDLGKRQGWWGVDRVAEVAFDTGIATDVELLGYGGTVATYATRATDPAVPYWPLGFKNIAARFPLDRIAEAHEATGTLGSTGRVVVDL